MPIARWDPFHNVAALQDRINRIFEDSFARSGEGDEDLSLCTWKPSVDIFATAEGIVLQADLPGLGKEDVSVEVKDNVLTLRGDRPRDARAMDDTYYRRERVCGAFQRSFSLRHAVAPDRIRARFKNGVLEIEIPNPEEDLPRQINVDIE